MKATCLVGSARSNGSTAYCIDTIIRGMQEAGMQTSKHCIGEKDIRYCAGCKKCYIDGECFQKDDVYEIVSDLINSDYVVIAAPSYWADVPGQLKTFFDRTTPYGDTNPRRKLQAIHPIKGIAIAIRAGKRKEENEIILRSIQHYFGHLGIETVKTFSICETDSLEDLLSRHQTELDELYQLGKEIANL